MYKYRKVILLLFTIITSAVAMEQVKLPKKMSVLIKKPDKLDFKITIDNNKTVADLKAEIEERQQISTKKQRLIFSGSILQDEKRLENVIYGFTPTIFLVLKKDEPPVMQEKITEIKKLFSRFITPQGIGAVITTAALITALAGVMKVRAYKRTKKRLIAKYNLIPLTSLQNKVWLATALASYGLEWYLNYLAQHTQGSLTDLVGADPRAVTELYYGHVPTAGEQDAFFSKFFFPKRESSGI